MRENVTWTEMLPSAGRTTFAADELPAAGDIVRVGVAVAVDISLELARAYRDVVEQELRVVGIGVAVLSKS